MPFGPTRMPSAVRVGVSGAAGDMLPQPASSAAARIEALSNFMQFLLQLMNRENKAG
jgi:hypothetical protein